ncbi:SMI1/KNR4 family protein [Paenibacillus sp. GCM10027627]|uniref:SMI1/KNR4 family protein n=1 Tax=unclassified Paenibacillus TaxID=185978 RepID=UPI00362E0CFC
MGLLGSLSNEFSVVSMQPPASVEDINRVKKISEIEVPPDYLDIVLEASEVEISVKNEMYIRIWGPITCIEMNEAYSIQKYIPSSLAIGDNEGGKALIYLSGKKGLGLYLVGFGDLDYADAVFVASSLKDLFISKTGVKLLLEL